MGEVLHEEEILICTNHVRILREAVGLELLPWARPQDTIQPRAPLKAEILCKTFGILPLVDLRTPICSLVLQTQSCIHSQEQGCTVLYH